MNNKWLKCCVVLLAMIVWPNVSAATNLKLKTIVANDGFKHQLNWTMVKSDTYLPIIEADSDFDHPNIDYYYSFINTYTVQELAPNSDVWSNIHTKKYYSHPLSQRTAFISSHHGHIGFKHYYGNRGFKTKSFSHTTINRKPGKYRYRLHVNSVVDARCADQKRLVFKDDGSRICSFPVYNSYSGNPWNDHPNPRIIKTQASRSVSVLVPDAPSELKVNRTSSGEGFAVSWNKTTYTGIGNVFYDVEESIIGDTDTDSFGFRNIYTGTNLNIETKHAEGDSALYRVKACHQAGCGAWAETVQIDIVQEPDKLNNIQILTANDVSPYLAQINSDVFSAGDFRLFFHAPSNISKANVTSYRVRVSKDGGAFENLEKIDSNFLAYEFGLGHYRTYYREPGEYKFQVQACNDACGCGDFADSVNAVHVVDRPGKPNKPVASPFDSDGNITLDWVFPSGSMATYYEVIETEQQTGQNVSMRTDIESAYFNIVSDSNTLITMNRTPGTYTYRVRGCSLAGCGEFSDNSNNVTVHPPGTPDKFGIQSWSHPEKNEAFASTSFANDDAPFKVIWEAYDDTVGIDIIYNLVEISSEGVTKNYNNIKSPFSIANKEEGRYSYQLQACTADLNRCGSPTHRVNIDVISRPSVPIINVLEVNDNTINVEWSEANHANRYELSQRIGDGEWKVLVDNSNQTSRQLNTTLTGTNLYSFRVRACNGPLSFDLCGSDSNVMSDYVTSQYSISPAPLPSIGIAPTQDQADDSDRVGSISGQFRVDESGAATYSIDIDTAPGTAGVTPTMGLYYSSQGGNGLVGQGWNITGTSSISRCRSTLGQDNRAVPITWSKNDRFCLDGQRLIAVSGDYGASDAIYRTEVDTYVEVTAVNDSNGNPDYFKVTRKDGSTSYYGQSVDKAGNITKSKLTFGTKVLTWSINQFADSVGNQITFTYYNDESSQRIKEVGYAYGESDTTPNATINYEYEDRPDRMSTYISGEQQIVTKRLKAIRSFNDHYLLREYKFKYETTTHLNAPSHLTSLKMCTDGDVCLPETTFNWITSSNGDLANDKKITPVYSYGTDERRNSYVSDSKFGDINGDGLTDIIYTTSYIKLKKRFLRKPKVKESYQRLYYLINTGTEFEVEGNFFYPSNYEEPIKVATLDYNGDGRTDVMVKSTAEPGDDGYRKADSDWHIYLATVSSSGRWTLKRDNSINFPFSSEDIGFTDMNGDGLVDAFDGTNYWLLERSGSSVSTQKPYAFSAKGRLDYKKSFDWDSSDVAGNVSNNPSYYSGSDAGVKAAAGDINGDGLGDFLVQSTGYQITLSHYENGVLSFVPAKTNSPRISDHSVTQFADINADGLSDVVYWHKGSRGLLEGWKVQLSTGKGFADPIEINQIKLDIDALEDDEERVDAAINNQVQLVDTNNDGYIDILWRIKNELLVRRWNQQRNTFNAVETYVSDIYRGEKQFDQHIVADFNNDTVNDYAVYQSQNEIGGHFVFTYADVDEVTSTNKINSSFGNIINSITNGLGAVTEITYEHLNQSDAYTSLEPRVATNDYSEFNAPFNDLPEGSETLQEEPLTSVFVSDSPIPVVTRIDSSAPTALHPEAKSAIEYGYGYAKVQAGGRGNLGFKYLSTKDVQTGVVTTNTYRQDWPFIGYPLKTEVRTKDGHLLSSSTSQWVLNGYDQVSMVSDAKAGGTSAIGSVQAYVAETVERSYALSENGRAQGVMINKTITNTVQDLHGNVTTLNVRNYEHEHQTEATQEGLTTHTYGNNDNDYNQKMGRLSNTIAVTKRLGQGTRTRESSFSYFTQGDLKGLLKTETIQPGGDRSLTLTTEHEYDEFGNRVHSKSTGWDGYNNGNVTRYGPRNEYDTNGRYMQASFQIFPGKGEVQISEVIKRNEYGAPTQVADINGVNAYTSYSKMGVAYFSTSDIGGGTETYLSNDVMGNLCPSHAAYVQISKAAGGAESRECFDKLARSIRELSMSFDGSWVAVDTSYDNIGRTVAQSEPFFIQSYSEKGALFSTVEYDITGRPTSSKAANGAVLTTVYDGNTKTETNARDQIKTETINSLGETILIVDHDGGVINYYHNEDGDLVQMVDGAGNETHILYDALSRKTGMSDPDKGSWSYTYNAFGELVAQTDAKGQVIETVYDALGRKVKRTDYKQADGEIENTTQWFFDNKENAIGQIGSLADSQGYSMTYVYDNYGRNYKSQMTLPGLGNEVFTSSQTYDAFGRPFQAFDASSNQKSNGIRGVETVYNQYGFVSETRNVRKGSSGSPTNFYQRTMAVDARGNVTRYELGNGVIVNKTFHEATGLIDHIESTAPIWSGNGLIQDIDHLWDKVGNLEYRHKYRYDENSGIRHSLQETFVYDNLNRLELITLDSQGIIKQDVLTYDLMGNIKSKTDVGDYSYGNGVNAGPHAVTQAGDSSFKYDANGNNTSSISLSEGDRSLEYSVFDKVTKVTRGSHQTEFMYGAERSRYKRIDTNSEAGGTDKTTYYLGNVEFVLYEKGERAGQREYKRQLGMALETIHYDDGAFVKEEIHYILQDHLGSTDVITDGDGKTVKEFSFDPWGQRRNEIDWLPLEQQKKLVEFDTNITTRGYTGHEMVDGVGIIHMNGRIYDAKLARFLQADPVIQDPYNTQSLNRYSYVWNNPLNATDPSGYTLLSLANLFVALKAAAVAFVVTTTFALVQGASLGQALGSGLKAGFTAFVGTFLTAGFTDIFGSDLIGQAVSSGLTGGITSTLSGGDFGDGFIGSALSAGLGGSFKPEANGSAYGRVLKGALIGGTVSELTGGKFANGAASGAASSVVNDAVFPSGKVGQASAQNKNNGSGNTGTFDPAIDYNANNGKPFASEEAALLELDKNIEAAFQKDGGKYEYGGFVVENSKGIFITDVGTTMNSVGIHVRPIKLLSAGFTARIFHHRHPNNSVFSGLDTHYAGGFLLTGIGKSGNPNPKIANSNFRVTLRHNNTVSFFRANDPNNQPAGGNFHATASLGQPCTTTVKGIQCF